MIGGWGLGIKDWGLGIILASLLGVNIFVGGSSLHFFSGIKL